MITEPWFAYPPEVNAARIKGVGPLNWYIAAGVWAMQALQAGEAQAVYGAQNATQVAFIDGATSAAVEASIAPFASWIATMQASAAQASLDNKAVGDAYVAALTSTVPLPVIAANRAAFAASMAANAVGAVNPAAVALQAQYEGFHIQNAVSMTSYDALATTATAPRMFPVPPPLTSGAEGMVTGDAVTQAISQAADQDFSAITSQAQQVIADPAAMQQLQQQAGAAALSPESMPLTGQMLSPVYSAMSPAGSYMTQMASPIGGVMGNGLGSGSSAMTGLGSSPHGGLPIGSGGIGSGGIGSGAAGIGAAGIGAAGFMGVGASPLSSPPPGAPAAGMPKAFSGVPAAERMATSPGGMRGPLGGVGRGRGEDAAEKTEAQMDAEVVEYVDPVAEEEQRRATAELFR